MDSPKDIDAPGPSDASEFVKQVIETMNLRPDLLKLSTFALHCIDYACQRKNPASLASSTLSDESQLSAATLLSQDSAGSAISASTANSAYAVSNYESTSYYNGITDEGEHPDLLYRTGSAKYPWIQPSGRYPYQPTKSLRGVYRTPLNDVWSTVGPQVRKLVKDRKIRYSIDPARFVTHGEDGEETLGPVVIWIGVYPGSTSADTAHEVSQSILELLEKNGVKDVEVEWHEAVSWKAAGPALLHVVGNYNPTVYVRRHLTAALGMPIATAEGEMNDAQGSVGFFFHEGRDKHGNPSTKVFGVSNRHVLREKIKGKYEFKGPGAPRQYVRVNGLRRFQRGLDEIKVSIGDHGIIADLEAREVIELEAKGTSEDEDEAEEDATELRKTRESLEEHKFAIADLEKLYDDVRTQWSDIELRNIGHVHYSPPISVDVEGEQYTEDWGTFDLEEAKFKAQFKGNVVDLGTAIAPEKLTAMMYPQSDGGTAFLYPLDRQLRINGIVTRELLANPDLYDSKGQPCLVVLKDGCTTDLTVGRYAGLESFLCDENGVESIELAIYNYDKKAGPFSAKGDSGSLIFDGLGRMVGLLHSGKSKGGSTSAHVTYATPAWWLIDRIKAKYPHADFNRTTW
ncbi:hypothetical protein M407DRAFT_241424 [Tulasnella calospora MUT 4182]|uniref:Uncharacterized protein n=1 Tax=Tulasnella calospora MUT 4182 TaxID=1051891 RepID=A0A0C3QTL3_9AGAM|nr:hypothetical protein M407DRAFT_241424 [Tulasnella calospora MUT 4182]